MSATAEPSWLRTVDHAGPAPDAILELSDADRAPRLSGQEGNNLLAQRLEASKTLRNAGVTVKDEKSANELAQRVLAAHVPASLTCGRQHRWPRPCLTEGA